MGDVQISSEAAALVCHFLEDLASRMHNAGCNDFTWPEFMTESDIDTIWSLIRDWDDNFSSIDEPPDITFDWLVVGAIGEHIDDRMCEAVEFERLRAKAAASQAATQAARTEAHQ